MMLKNIWYINLRSNRPLCNWVIELMKDELGGKLWQNLLHLGQRLILI